ncbi:MAG: hypothetical protein LBG58_06785 [Planctomycetaceae bacterium]|jgi:hypothetical protein|nr:hypothetical protein [Planctomycetaceae bacterium]
MKRINTILDFSEQNVSQSVTGRFLWKFAVLTISMLLTITLAFCQERKTEENLLPFDPAKIKSYQVNKNVAEFSGDANFSDLSTPENAYVTYSRTYCNPNPNLGDALSKIAIPSLRAATQKNKSLKNPPEDWSNILLSAQVLEVRIYENQAMVIAKLEGENVKSPYDVRHFEKIDGKWFNAGNDRFNSVAEASQKFRKLLQIKQNQENEWEENRKWLQDGLDKMKSLRFYTVGKRVDEFSDNNLTTPESLYATINNVMASKDKTTIKKLQEDFNLAKTAIPEREINNMVNMPDDFAQVLKTAEIKQVYLFKDSFALVIAFLNGENVRNPYDVRWCEKKDGKWFNVGNDRVDSIDTAINMFVKKCKSLQETGKLSDNNVSEKRESLPSENIQKVQQTGWTTPDDVKHTHLCIFEPVGDFKPQTPQELLDKLNAPLQKTGIITGYFRTWAANGKLIGGICTNNAEGLDNVIKSIPELKLLNMKRLDTESFNKHVAKEQESL